MVPLYARPLSLTRTGLRDATQTSKTTYQHTIAGFRAHFTSVHIARIIKYQDIVGLPLVSVDHTVMGIDQRIDACRVQFFAITKIHSV